MFKLSRQQKDHRYFCGNRYEKYSIKKLKVGAASVLIGAGFLFGYNVDTVEADSATETVVTKDADTGLNQAQGNTQAGTVSEPKAELAEKPKSNAGLEKSAEPAKPVKENEKDTEQASAVSAHTNTAEATEAKPSVDLSLLQEKLADLEAQIERIRGNKKQASQIQNAEKLVAEAKQYLSALGATQSGADKKAKEISALTTILKSIKAEETVKENKNQDSRNGKKMQEGTGFRTDTATGTGISADVEDATSTPKVERPGYTNREHSEKLASQVTWLDFADKNHWTNIDEENGKIYLKEGSVYENDVYPDYRIRVRVKSLKPFQATEIYRKRMEARGATDEEKATFDPNATNQYLTRGDGQGAPARLTASAQDEWSEIRDNGINTNGKKTSIAVDKPGSNWGIQFEISASYKGKTIRPAVLMADAESANPGENIIFTTNGDGWEQIIELKKNREDAKPYTPTNLDNLHNTELTDTDVPRGVSKYNWNRLKEMMDGTTLVPVGQNGKKVALKYYANPDKETGGLETGVFGPSMTAGPYSVPVVMTKDASEVGMYVLSQGMQSAMMGVIPLDEGDAPESYGEAVHTINSKNTFTGAEVKQPYLGSNRPDPDTNSKKNWYGDDESGDADEGVNQLLPDNLKGNEGSIIKANVSIAGNYTLTIQAHTGGAEKAYVRSWIDFNKNGKFDDDEASEIATITQDGTVELNFKNKTATNVEKLLEAGTRVRISNTESEIVNPTGIAFSGEVEDFVAKITHPPKGEKKTTIGNIKETQREEIHFTAQGKNVYVREDIDAEIDATVQPTYIDNKTGQVVTLSSDGTYTVEGEGTYKFAVSDNGKDVKAEFTPADGFVGKANGISIRRQDTNKTTTNWGTNDATTLPSVNDSLNTMDGLYIPEVTPPTSISATPVNAESQNLQGFPQKGKPTFTVETSSTPVTASAKYPAKLVDPRTNTVTELTTVDAFEKGTTNKIGTYTIVPETGEVTFTPNKDFKGIPAPATISADVELTHYKDGHVTTKTLTATYTPTIIPVEPTAIASTTIGPKGKPQTSPIKLDEEETGEDKDKTVNFNKGTQEGPNRERVELDSTTLTLVNDAGAEVESVVTSDGTYTLNKAEKTITFTPNEDFVGTAKPVNVRIKDANGTKADTTYTPTVRPVTTFVDSSGTPITVDKNNTPVTPEEDGTQPNKSIYGYKFVRTETDDKGNTKHVYETVKGNVLVKYVDETGAPLAGTASIPGNATEAVTADGVKAVTEAELGTSYDNKVAEKKATKITTADGKVYELVTENNGVYNTSEPETGTVTEADKVVTFVYKEKKSAVNVKYVDKNGQAIAGTATMPGDTTEEVTVDGLKPVTDASVNTDYNVADKKATKITTADGKVYRLIAERDGLLDGSKPASGKVEENEITVTYQYELLGSVVTKYELSDGTELTGELTFDNATTPTTVEEKGLAVANATDVSNGTNYDASTPANKPNKITTATGEVYYLVSSDNGVKAGSATVTGTVEEGKTKEVTYVYEKAGSVVIKYINTDGTEIKTSVQDSTNVKAGTAYNAAETDEKPATIEFNNKKYKLVTKEGTTTTNATYSAEAVVTNGENVGAVEGQVVAGKTLEVTYVYEEVKGNVLVKYVDEKGTPLAGTASLPGDKTETVTTDGVKAVTEAELGTSYDNKVAEKKATKITTADGKVYELVTENNGVYNTSEPETGTVTEADKVVTFVYKEKKSAVNVKYVDKDGQPIAGTATMPNDSTETVTVNGLKPVTDASVNSDYNVSDKKASKITTTDGKVYRLIAERDGLLDGSKPASGKVEEDEITVTYQYELLGSVVTKYELSDGTKLTGALTFDNATSATEVGEKGLAVANATDVSNGTNYDASTSANKPNKITTATGEVYYLTTSNEGVKEGSATVTGTVEEGKIKEVTYVYEKAGSVVIKYINTEGTEIKATVQDSTNAKPGTAYNAAETDEKPATIEFNNKKYKLVTKEGTTTTNATYSAEAVVTNGENVGAAEGQVVSGKTLEVTYVYEEVKGNVLVKYVDETGAPLAGTASIPGNTTEAVTADGVKAVTEAELGTSYDNKVAEKKATKITTADGKVYELVTENNGLYNTSEPETGTVTEADKVVTFVYKEKKSAVNVKYVDKSGQPIAGTATMPGDSTEEVTADGLKPVTNASVNTDYNVEDKKASKITTADGKVYRLIAERDGLLDGSKPVSGKVEENEITVTYQYELVNGNVTVSYKDTEGNKIPGYETPKDAEKDAPTGKAFNTATTELKPAKITTPDGKVYNLVPGRTEGNESGKVTETPQNVTYVYELAKGDVTVNYKDTEGNKIPGYETPKTVETQSPTGKEYTTVTEALKPSKITTTDGKVYNLVPTRTEGNEKGKVTEEPQNVTYVYELAKGNVTVTYKDTEGNTIEGYETPKDAEKDAPTGKDFNTATDALKPSKITTTDGKVYNLVPTRTEGNEKGKVTEEPQNVTYVYELAKGDVTVTYKDTEGNKIPGYETPKTVETQSPTGKEYTTVTEALKPSKITTPDGKVYNLVPTRTEGNESGKVTENPQNVTYVYELSKGDVTVKYENEAGESIKPDNNLKSQVPTGDDYNTTTVKDLTITKDGKLYKLVEKNGGVKEGSSVENGKVTETPAVVTYVYSEVKGEIIQKFVDESGKEIKDPTNTGKKSLSEKVNLEYPKRITDKNGKVYEFVKVDKIPTNFTEQPQTATYTYRAVKGQGVTVSYETTTGVTLKETQTVQPKDTVVGTDYDTSTETLKPERIEKDGKVYLLKEQTKAGSAEEKGKVSEQPQNVTYVYEEVKEPETKRNHGSVVVLYTDQSGRPISGITDKGKEVGSTVIDIANAPVNTKYDTTDNRPQTITTKDGKVYKLKKVTKNSDAEQSGVKGRTSVVTYVYEMLSPTQELPEAKIGVVLVNYQDEDGNPISGKTTEGKEVPNVVVDTDAALVDTEYDTTDHKPSVIITENGDVYELVKVSETSVEKGKVVEGTTIVDYIYRKVVTTYVDEEGKEINPSDKGTKDKKDIPEYIFKETKKDEKGNTTHVYRQVVTSYVNEEGKEISPSDKGTKDKKDIPEYIFKETKKDKDGNTIHVYTKKSSSTPYSPTPSTPSNEESKSTVWKDTEGNVLKPQEDGTKDKGTFTGYEYVKTILVGNVTTHIFKKVITPSHDGTPSHSEVPGQSDKPNHSDVTATSDKSTQIVNSNESTFVDGKRELPNTGTQSSTSSLLLGALAAITGLGLVSRRRKDDKE